MVKTLNEIKYTFLLLISSCMVCIAITGNAKPALKGDEEVVTTLVAHSDDGIF